MHGQQEYYLFILLSTLYVELLAAAARLPLPGGSLAVPGRAAELEWAEVADY